MKFHCLCKAVAIFLFFFCSYKSVSAQDALIKIDTDRRIGEISPDIYGSFLEPINQIVYGKLYNPQSQFSDENGFRKDLIEFVKELKITNVRWPGGNYVSAYNWEDGIGPKEQRPVRYDVVWKNYDHNQMGTDEYVKFCNLIGAENFICINSGTGTLDQARHWVEYCNIEKGTFYSDLRRKYGNEKPHNVKYWALGNEPDGWWQMGHKNSEDYCKFAKEASKLMRQTDPGIKLIAAGASDYSPGNEWIEWNRDVLHNLVGYIDYISMHRYIKNKDGFGDFNRNFSEFMAMGFDVDQKIDLVKSQITEAMIKSGAKRKIFIAFDEFNGQGNNLTAALMMAQFFNSFIRHADIVKLANYSFLSNLFADFPGGLERNPHYYSFYLFSNNCQGTALDVYVDCESYSAKNFNNIPYLDVSSVFNEDKNQIIVNVVNRHEIKSIPSELVLQEGRISGEIEVSEVNGKSVTDTNNDKEQKVKISTSTLKGKGNSIKYEFPPHSFTQMRFDIDLTNEK